MVIIPSHPPRTKLVQNGITLGSKWGQNGYHPQAPLSSPSVQMGQNGDHPKPPLPSPRSLIDQNEIKMGSQWGQNGEHPLPSPSTPIHKMGQNGITMGSKWEVIPKHPLASPMPKKSVQMIPSPTPGAQFGLKFGTRANGTSFKTKVPQEQPFPTDLCTLNCKAKQHLFFMKAHTSH